MKWFEYDMEVDRLHAPDELKARLLAMQPAPEAAHPSPASQKADKNPGKPKGQTVRFPHWRRWAAGIAACAAVAVVGSQALVAIGPAGAGISTMSMMAGGAASSTASSAAAAYDRAAPEAAVYSLDENGLASARSTDGGRTALAGEKIIYTAEIALETKDYDAARAALEQALAAAGGWMESSNEYSYDNARSLSMTLRVPADNYDSFLAAAGQTASLVRRSEHADDVTAAYTDAAGRIANLEGQRDRLRELQASAESLSDLLDIEAQLSDVQYQLESWQAQLDWYDDQVASCTVTVRLQEVETYTPTGETFLERLGAAFAEGWQNFVRALAAVAVVLAGWWPVVLIAAAVIAAVAVIRIRRRR